MRFLIFVSLLALPAFSQPVRVLLFIRSDCPISNRYAPELTRIAREFESRGVHFELVFPDSAETQQSMNDAVSEYHFPGTPVLDPKHALVRQAHAETAPEAAVFNTSGHLAYHGRIDDRYVDVGKSRPEAHVHDLEDAITAVLDNRPVRQPVTKAVGCSLADVE